MAILLSDSLSALDKRLLRLAAAVLVAVALLKIVSALFKVAYLARPDPVFPFLSTRALLVIAGDIEMLFAVVIALRPRAWYARCGLLALCASFVVYRLGLLALHVRAPCPCLGRASDWLRLSPRQTDALALLILVGLTVIAVSSMCINARLQGGRDLDKGLQRV